MFIFTENERVCLREFRALATDSGGNEVLAGLSVEETAFLMSHRRKFVIGIRDHDAKKRALELNKKHEIVRLSILGAEIQRRNFDTPLQ
jgi:hypothetical protein